MTEWNERTVERELKKLDGLDADRIAADVAKAWQITEHSIVAAALGLRRLEELGYDLGKVQIPDCLKPRLLKIAYGQMLPGLLHRFLGRLDLVDRISALPKPEQQRLLESKTGVKVTSLDAPVLPDGTRDATWVPLEQLRGSLVSQVFDRDHVRDIAEQVTWLRAKARRSHLPAAKKDVNVRSDGIDVLMPMFIPKHQLIDFLGRMP